MRVDITERSEKQMFNLLADELLTLRSGSSERRRRSLPQLLAALAGGAAVEFAHLQPHQSHAWHAFLVQLAALAVHRTGSSELPDDPGRWRELLLALTDGEEAPWCLVVSDPARPAFMQPPIPEGDVEAFGKESTTPEAIDLLVTAKNHDVKRERFTAPQADHWIFAMVALQTMEGFSGRDNYGIARMNGGFASRPGIAAVPDLRWSSAFRRDVSLLLARRRTLLADWPFRDDGLALLWLEPWDGSESLDLSDLDPFFIEICRRIRLIAGDGELVLRWTSTKKRRVDAEKWNGALGDLWTPINRDEKTALTVSDRGFDYRLVADLLFQERFEPSPAQQVDGSVGPEPVFVARALVRGQGKTGGYQEREIPIPGKIVGWLEDQAEVSRIGNEAQRRIETVQTAQRKVLRPALLALHQGGGAQISFKDEAPRSYLAEHDREIDRIFFGELFADEAAKLLPEEKGRRWERRVYELTEAVFERALDEMPKPDARRYRAIAAAEGRFYGGAKKNLPLAFDRADDEAAQEEQNDAT